MDDDLDQAVIVALGSNLPGAGMSPAEVLRTALNRLAESGLTPVRTSRWWRSRAWPDPSHPDYLNAVALVEASAGPCEVLGRLKTLERGFGARSAERNAPRVLDLDLIAYGRAVMQTEALVLPHPRASERRFVMGPLAEIAPGWRHPVSGETAQALAESAAVARDAAPVSEPSLED